MINELQRAINKASKVVAAKSSLLAVLSDAVSSSLNYSTEFDRRGATLIPFTAELQKTFGKLTGEELLLIEECLDDLGAHFGFGIDFDISDGGFKARVVVKVPDDDRPPIDDGDDDPVQEFENADIVKVVAELKTMSAHA